MGASARYCILELSSGSTAASRRLVLPTEPLITGQRCHVDTLQMASTSSTLLKQINNDAGPISRLECF